MTVFKGDFAVKIQRGRSTSAARKIGNLLDVVHVVFLRSHHLFAAEIVTLKESVEESLKGITINGAKSLRRDKTKGSIEPGKDADLVIMDSSSVAYPIYHFAHNHCEKVFVKGKQIL